MYSKLTHLSIDKYKYSKSKYSETSAQTALRIYCSLPQCPQTSSGAATGLRDTYPRPTGIISLQRQPGFNFFLLHFREKIKRMGCLESLVMMTSCFLSSVLDIHQRMNTTYSLHPSLASGTLSLARALLSTHHPQLWCCRVTSSPTLLYTHLLHQNKCLL